MAQNYPSDQRVTPGLRTRRALDVVCLTIIAPAVLFGPHFLPGLFSLQFAVGAYVLSVCVVIASNLATNAWVQARVRSALEQRRKNTLAICAELDARPEEVTSPALPHPAEEASGETRAVSQD